MKKEYYSKLKRDGQYRQQTEGDLDRVKSTGFNYRDLSTEDLEELLVSEGIATAINGIIGQGKEANVYWLSTTSGFAAAKLFRTMNSTHQSEFSKKRSKTFDRLEIASGYCLKEFQLLSTLYEHKVRVPRPLEQTEFVYLMQFLGDEFGPAPLLRDTNIRRYGVDPGDVLDDLLDQMELMFNKAQMAHGDLSEHNIIWYQELPWIIDVFQAKRWHPYYATELKVKKSVAYKIFKKDLHTVIDYFKRNYRVFYDEKEVLENMIEHDTIDWVPDQLLDDSHQSEE